MAKQETVVSGMAGRYALALHELAEDTRETAGVGADLDRFSAMIEASPDLARFIRSPVLTAQEQGRALDALLAKAGIGGAAANFIRLVARKRRLFALPAMIKGFHALDDAKRGVTRAEAVVAHPLNEEQERLLRQTIADIARQPSVQVAVKVDPGIIGGLVVKLGSRMIDGSLRTKLDAIRVRMTATG